MNVAVIVKLPISKDESRMKTLRVANLMVAV